MATAVRRWESVRRRVTVAGLLVGLVIALPASVQAARSWTVVADPDELVVDASTAVLLTVTNTSSSGSGMTCVEFDLPSDFNVSGAAVVSVKGQSGGSLLGWSAVWPGGSTVAFKSTLGSGALEEDDQAVFRITGTATTAGLMSWTTVAYDEPGLPLVPSCGSNAYPAATLEFTVSAPTPTPTPRPTRTPAPTAKATPKPTPTPGPSLIALPSLPPLATLLPLPLDTPRPGATPLGSARPSSEASKGPGRTEPASGPGDAGQPARSPQASSRSPDPPPGGGLVIPGNRDPGEPIEGVGDTALATLTGLPGGLLAWAYPVLVISVPGLLLVLAVAAQAVGAFAWLPLIRRRLGAFELRRRRLDG